MKVISIEPTPSPNSMKLNLDESLPKGIYQTYTQEHKEHYPQFIQKLLDIEGVKSVFHSADFISIDRIPKGEWKSILAQARAVFGETADNPISVPDMTKLAADETFGEVKVLVQSYRGIPMQVRVKSGTEELRASMPERFTKLAMGTGALSPNFIRERKLEEKGVRYGELQDILDEVVRELEAAYDDERLAELSTQAANMEAGEPIEREQLSFAEMEKRLDDPDWKRRYAALDRMKPNNEALPLLVKALADPEPSLRRLATVYLGDIQTPEALPYLFQALEDKAASVRRTAGDTLSDLGDPAAIPAMIKALQDRNKLVRWRAAHFLYENGDETAIGALRQAENDPEFEVSMQVKIALERIEGGEAAEGSVWQQMTRSRLEQ